MGQGRQSLAEWYFSTPATDTAVTLPGTCSWRLASTSGFSKRAPNLSITPIPLENVMRMDSPLSRRNFLAGTIGAAAVSNGIPFTATFGDVEQSVSQTK